MLRDSWLVAAGMLRRQVLGRQMLGARIQRGLCVLLLSSFLGHATAANAAQTSSPPAVTIDWTKILATTRTTITLQVVENPPLLRSSPIHDQAWASLAALHTDMTRLALWYPYPRLAVAELEAPTRRTTSWNFNQIDPIVEVFFHATAGHSSVFTMSTIPRWMFQQDAHDDTRELPTSPDVAVWEYESGSALRDPTGQEVADYFARVASWYSAGGFVDELGQRHASPHHHTIAWWEVLNEPEYEHALSIENYTRLYDRIVTEVRRVAPSTRFVGMSLAEPMRSPQAFEYFLNPANHTQGIPIDAISYHFYADAEPGESDGTQQFTFFDHADTFLNSVRYIENIRKRLSPATQTHINEAGCIAADDFAQGKSKMGTLPSAQYWNLCGAVFAYLYAGLAEQGIDVLGASQLVGYPSQFPSVTLLDWKTGAPNARYRLLELLHDNFGPGDRIIETSSPSAECFAAAYLARDGQKKVLLINKRNHAMDLKVSGASGATEQHVDITTGGSTFSAHRLASDSIHLEGLSVMVISSVRESKEME